MLFDILMILACILAPWMLVVTLLIIGLISFPSWFEGIVFAVLLDIVLFGGEMGLHTLYVLGGFCALYYVTIRVKHALRIA